MPKTEEFRVIREHGEFKEGDIRKAARADVAHLIPNCLEPIDGSGENEEEEIDAAEGEKAEGAAPSNKAVTAAPANKASARKGKKGR